MSGRALVFLAGWTWALTIGVVPSSGDGQGNRTREDLSEFLPPGAGKALVARECSSCHDLGGTIRLRSSKAAWEAVVLDMAARGAPLMIDDVDTIVAYLAGAFGPQAPPLVDANTATVQDLAKLPGLTPAEAEQIVARRRASGRFSSRDEVRTAAGLDAERFERIKWYLDVRPKP